MSNTSLLIRILKFPFHHVQLKKTIIENYLGTDAGARRTGRQTPTNKSKIIRIDSGIFDQRLDFRQQTPHRSNTWTIYLQSRLGKVSDPWLPFYFIHGQLIVFPIHMTSLPLSTRPLFHHLRSSFVGTQDDFGFRCHFLL